MPYRCEYELSPVDAARDMRQRESKLERYNLSCIKDNLVARGMLPNAAERSVEAYRAFIRDILWGDRFKKPTPAANLALNAHLIHESHFRAFIGDIYPSQFKLSFLQKCNIEGYIAEADA